MEVLVMIIILIMLIQIIKILPISKLSITPIIIIKDNNKIPILLKPPPNSQNNAN